MTLSPAKSLSVSSVEEFLSEMEPSIMRPRNLIGLESMEGLMLLTQKKVLRSDDFILFYFMIIDVIIAIIVCLFFISFFLFFCFFT